jgi:hypothetical protein
MAYGLCMLRCFGAAPQNDKFSAGPDGQAETNIALWNGEGRARAVEKRTSSVFYIGSQLEFMPGVKWVRAATEG